MKGGSDEKNAVYAVRSLPAFALCRLRTAAPDDIQQVPVSPLPEKMAMARACESALLESCDEETAENAIAFQRWLREQKALLREKYHVKITY